MKKTFLAILSFFLIGYMFNYFTESYYKRETKKILNRYHKSIVENPDKHIAINSLTNIRDTFQIILTNKTADYIYHCIELKIEQYDSNSNLVSSNKIMNYWGVNFGERDTFYFQTPVKNDAIHFKCFIENAIAKPKWAITNDLCDKKKLEKVFTKNASEIFAKLKKEKKLNDKTSTDSSHKPFTNVGLNKQLYEILEKKKKGYYPEALNDINKLLNENPDFAEGYFFKAQIEAENPHNYQTALEDFTKAIQLKPNYAEAYCNRGLIKNLIGEFSNAILDFKSAIKYKHDYGMAYYGMGCAKTELENFESALEDLNKSILYKPDYHPAYLYRGIARYFYGSSKNDISQTKNACLDFIKAKEMGNKMAEKFIIEYCNE